MGKLVRRGNAFRRRPKLPRTKGVLDIVAADTEKETVTVRVGGVERTYQLKRHPSPYGVIAKNQKLQTKAQKSKATLENVIFKAPDEKKTLIFTLPDGDIIHATPGSYGGFVLGWSKVEKIGGVPETALFISPSEEIIARSDKETEQYLRKFMPHVADELMHELGAPSSVRRTKYKVYLVKLKQTKKAKGRYVVLDIDKVLDEGEGEAIRFWWYYGGSRKYPKAYVAGRKLAQIKPILVKAGVDKNFYTVDPVDIGLDHIHRDSILAAKFVTKTPKLETKRE